MRNRERKRRPLRALRVAAAMLAAVFASGCAGALFGLANAPTYFGSLKRLGGAAYGPGAREKLDVYAPADAQSAPVVIFWYGGGWTAGSREEYRFVGSALASRGIVAVLPDYALYPQVVFPAFLQDPARAVAWVEAHAREFGGDPARIVLMGHSAGAHMAAFLAYQPELLRAAGADPAAIRGFIGLSGPYVLEPNTDILNTIFAPPHTVQDWQPARFVQPGAPPTLLFHGLKDRVVDPKQTIELADRLRMAGTAVETVMVPKRGHADTVAAFAWAARGRAPVLEKSVEFVKRVTQR